MSEINNRENLENFIKKLRESSTFEELPAPEEPVKTFTQRDWLESKEKWEQEAHAERQREIKGTKTVMPRTLATLETNHFYNTEQLEFLFDIRKNEGLMEILEKALSNAAVKYKINDQGLVVEEFKPEFLNKAEAVWNNRKKIGNRNKKNNNQKSDPAQESKID
jgi:hypothetical protein